MVSYSGINILTYTCVYTVCIPGCPVTPFLSHISNIYTISLWQNTTYNKATRSPEISHQQVQKLTPPPLSTLCPLIYTPILPYLPLGNMKPVFFYFWQSPPPPPPHQKNIPTIPKKLFTNLWNSIKREKKTIKWDFLFLTNTPPPQANIFFLLKMLQIS